MNSDRQLDRFGMDPGAWFVCGLQWFLGICAITAAIVLPVTPESCPQTTGHVRMSESRTAPLSKIIDSPSRKTGEATAVQKPSSVQQQPQPVIRQKSVPHPLPRRREDEGFESMPLWRIDPITGMPL